MSPVRHARRPNLLLSTTPRVADSAGTKLYNSSSEAQAYLSRRLTIRSGRPISEAQARAQRTHLGHDLYQRCLLEVDALAAPIRASAYHNAMNILILLDFIRFVTMLAQDRVHPVPCSSDEGDAVRHERIDDLLLQRMPDLTR